MIKQKQELIKPVVKMGNSACVLLPKAWTSGKARVELIEKPLDIKKDLFDILNPYLDDVIGIYLVGSYAREEQTINSDVDILVVTHKTHKNIDKGKYNILLIPKDSVEKQLMSNIFPLFPMLKESKPIINSQLIEPYKRIELTKRNLKYHIETTKSAMKVVEKSIELSKEMNTKESDASAYSLILRLRTLYITDCIRKNKMWKKREFLELVKKISGSLTAYERYVSSKNKKTLDCKLPIEESEKLMAYINKRIEELEKWLVQKERKGWKSKNKVC